MIANLYRPVPAHPRKHTACHAVDTISVINVIAGDCGDNTEVNNYVNTYLPYLEAQLDRHIGGKLLALVVKGLFLWFFCGQEPN